jgi:hypothetical protein
MVRALDTSRLESGVARVRVTTIRVSAVDEPVEVVVEDVVAITFTRSGAAREQGGIALRSERAVGVVDAHHTTSERK